MPVREGILCIASAINLHKSPCIKIASVIFKSRKSSVLSPHIPHAVVCVGLIIVPGLKHSKQLNLWSRVTVLGRKSGIFLCFMDCITLGHIINDRSYLSLAHTGYHLYCTCGQKKWRFLQTDLLLTVNCSHLSCTLGQLEFQKVLHLVESCSSHFRGCFLKDIFRMCVFKKKKIPQSIQELLTE